MSSDSPLEEAPNDAIAQARTRAERAGRTFVAELGAPATEDDLAALERRLKLTLPAELRRLLSQHNGVVAGTSDGNPMSRIVLRLYSCEEIIEATERLEKYGYITGGVCALGAWDDFGGQFVVASSGTNATVPGGVLATSPDDPSSFEGAADYPDLRTFIAEVLAEL